MERKINSVIETSDYSKFKVMEGNRDVSNARVSKILESFDEIGAKPIPIVVNEKYEVVDGQGRLEAFRRRGLPVAYIVIQGLTIGDCRYLNAYQTNWSVRDYMESFALTNDNYKRMLEFVNANEEQLGLSGCISMMFGGFSGQSNMTNSFKKGDVAFTVKDKNECERLAGLVSRFKCRRNNKGIFASAVKWADKMRGFGLDFGRLVEVCNRADKEFTNIHSVHSVIVTMKELYNNRARTRFDLVHYYEELSMQSKRDYKNNKKEK